MANKKQIIEGKISDLVPDDKNLNAGTEYGSHLMDKSFREFGAGRSILVDKNNRVIAGNKSLQAFAEVGMENVRIIESDGKELVVVKRTDVDLDSKKGREMALADNATSKANLQWDDEMLREVSEEYELNMEEWGVFQEEDGDLSGLFEETEAKADNENMTLTVEIPLDHEGVLGDIKSALEITLQEWKGCKVK